MDVAAVHEGLHAQLVEDADERTSLLNFLIASGLSTSALRAVFDAHLRGYVPQASVRQTVLLDDPERNLFVANLGWACLHGDDVRALIAHGPFIELGAGGGFVAHQILDAGGLVDAFDRCADGKDTTFLTTWARWPWASLVRKGSEEVLAEPEYQARTLLLCWPDVEARFAQSALARFGGSRLAFVGEARGGCTADNAFFDALERDWRLVEERRLGHFEEIDDWMRIYARA